MNKKEVLGKIRELFTSKEEEVAVATEEVVVENQYLDMKSKEGKILRVDELLVGSSIKEVTEDGLVDVEDGEYELEEDVKIVVEGGVIKDVEEMETEEEEEVEATEEEETFEEEVSEEVEAVEEVTEEVVEEEVSELEEILNLLTDISKNYESMKEEFNSLREENTQLKERFNKVANEPSEVSTPTKKVDFNKVTREERLKYFSK
jgi:chromosome segregation ATPase